MSAVGSASPRRSPSITAPLLPQRPSAAQSGVPARNRPKVASRCGAPPTRVGNRWPINKNGAWPSVRQLQARRGALTTFAGTTRDARNGGEPRRQVRGRKFGAAPRSDREEEILGPAVVSPAGFASHGTRHASTSAPKTARAPSAWSARGPTPTCSDDPLVDRVAQHKSNPQRGRRVVKIAEGEAPPAVVKSADERRAFGEQLESGGLERPQQVRPEGRPEHPRWQLRRHAGEVLSDGGRQRRLDAYPSLTWVNAGPSSTPAPKRAPGV